MRECRGRCARCGETQERKSRVHGSLVIVFAYDTTARTRWVSDIVATIPTGKADNVGRGRRIR